MHLVKVPVSVVPVFVIVGAATVVVVVVVVVVVAGSSVTVVTTGGGGGGRATGCITNIGLMIGVGAAIMTG